MKRFASRLAELERLEAIEAPPAGRFLDVCLHIRPAEYKALVTGGEDADRIWCAYSLDLIAPEDSVRIYGGAWPYPGGPLRAWERTIGLYNAPDGYACRIDEYDAETVRRFPRWPPFGDTHWAVAVGEDYENL